MEEEELIQDQPRTSARPSVSARLSQDADRIAKEDSEVLKEIAINSVDLNVATCSYGVSDASSRRTSFSRPVSAKMSFINKEKKSAIMATSQMPLIIINTPTTSRHAVTNQPRSFSFIRTPISPMSLVTQAGNQPPTLFMQALAKLNESKIGVAVMNDLLKIVERSTGGQTESEAGTTTKSPELSPPDSLTSAPPSYSFVLRQSARRRPRLMGTFIPSPSFVQHTPPPNYATAFDIYVDNPVPPQEPTRVYSFGFTSMPVICPECGYAGLTAITTKINLCTHFCAFILCLFCCWFCAPLPYVMRSCKDVYHHCRNCRALLGMYSPTSPEPSYSQVM